MGDCGDEGRAMKGGEGRGMWNRVGIEGGEVKGLDRS